MAALKGEWTSSSEDFIRLHLYGCRTPVSTFWILAMSSKLEDGRPFAATAVRHSSMRWGRRRQIHGRVWKRCFFASCCFKIHCAIRFKLCVRSYMLSKSQSVNRSRSTTAYTTGLEVSRWKINRTVRSWKEVKILTCRLIKKTI